jgi:hypothetical protein
MLMAKPDVPSSILPRSSSILPNSIETLDENESIEAQVNNVQSLALSSPNRDRSDDDDNNNNHDSVSIPPPIYDGYSSSSSDESQSVPSPPINLDHDDDECQIPIRNTSQALDDIDDDIWGDDDLPETRRPWTPNVSPGFGSDDDDDNDDDNSKNEPRKSLFYGFRQEPEPVTGVGAGLWNLGNSCFLNSVFQCFTHTVPLIESLLSFRYEVPCHCGNEFFCVIRAIRYHIEAALRPERCPIAPYFFFDNLNYFSPDFQRYQQEDAHEFLQAFLEKLEICGSDRTSFRGDITSQDVFSGRLISGLRCCNCDYVSETYEKSVGLSLEIEDVDTLGSALESFTRVEKLDEQLTCDNCNEKVSKEKQLLLDKLPLVATFHLKRFKNNGLYMEKIYKHVKIPLEIDLQPYMRNIQENEVCETCSKLSYIFLLLKILYLHFETHFISLFVRFLQNTIFMLWWNILGIQ